MRKWLRKWWRLIWHGEAPTNTLSPIGQDSLILPRFNYTDPMARPGAYEDAVVKDWLNSGYKGLPR